MYGACKISKAGSEVITNMLLVADPEIWNRGRKDGVWSGEGLCPHSRKFVKIFCTNHAFWCKYL